ncbi:unnamed protein product [Chondrus crispus]|uniref:Uncharacterized protein n=1 Tax=Chondrus crispus TaxID=2769 RepID=R7QAE0_CHOCR|nr:unnamed protein product [Chondrus crispus]CDF34396.1 unnamed protein product [Chondrus crispus]|eukprot:XP_005714215.1 unnamed protein product [Chondrus crispus]
MGDKSKRLPTRLNSRPTHGISNHCRSTRAYIPTISLRLAFERLATRMPPLISVLYYPYPTCQYLTCHSRIPLPHHRSSPL